jgi:major membrane immunogen (membrane-anchored lipoprotein)
MTSMKVHPAMVGVALALVLTACGSSGPGAIADGSYKAYAVSSGATPDAMLVIEGSSVTLTQDGTQSDFTMTDGTTEYTVCGTDGSGTPSPLGADMTVGDVDMVNPAIYGDCGQTSPNRVTVVDLDSALGSGGIGFASWAEFCDVNDSDC